MKDVINMVEVGVDEVFEEIMFEVIMFGYEEIKCLIVF